MYKANLEQGYWQHHDTDPNQLTQATRNTSVRKDETGTAYTTVIIATHGTTFIPQNETSGAPTVLKQLTSYKFQLGTTVGIAYTAPSNLGDHVKSWPCCNSLYVLV